MVACAKQKTSPNFFIAMQQEMDGLHGMFEIVLCSFLPEDTIPLLSIWAFKQKRLPDWTIQKLKAWIIVHCDE